MHRGSAAARGEVGLVGDELGSRRLVPFVPGLLRSWLADHPDARHRSIDGTLAFVDISGFTQLTERLMQGGKVGAEQLTDILDALFSELLEVARHDGAHLVKWGGDAVLLLFQGPRHAEHAARAAYRMRARLREFGKVRTPSGAVRLAMSVGLHSAALTLFLVGDPDLHRELIICGPASSTTARIRNAAQQDEIGVSDDTAALLARHCVDRSGPLPLLVAEPQLEDAAAAADDPEPPGLARTLSGPVREYLGAADFSSEHRKVAVGFVRLSGTDALARTGSIDAMTAALDECVRIVQHACARHAVTFLESDIDDDGAKIMLVSGAPRSSGNDEDRLLRTAQHIVSAPAPLGMQVGVHRGAVFTGVLGPAFCRTYSVKGDAVNLAARLAARARPGEALATADVLAQASAHFENEVLAPVRVKGKSAPVEVARLGRAVTPHRETERTGSHLVGREAELATLRSALGQAMHGNGALVEVVGEPGIGKSRLVQALLAESPAQSVVIACDEYETATPYYPFREVFCALLNIRDAGGLVQAVRDRGPELLPWLPLLARILDIEVPSTPEVDAIDDQFRRARLQEVTAQFLAIALPSPLVLVLEDVHLMDDASVDLLGRLCRDLGERSWLVVVTRRDVDGGFRPADGAAVSIRPTPLDTAAAAELAHALDAGRALPAPVLNALAVRAGGNPLFLRRLLVAAASGAELDALPDTVEALIVSQLDRLPARERTVLRYASVLGMHFDRSQLRELLAGTTVPRGSPDIVHRMDAYLREEGDALHFVHQLVRDTAYETLPFRLRRTLHGIAGDLLESRATSPDDVAEVLSLHYINADRPDKAWRYSRIGGERAAAKYAYEQAEQLFARAAQAARQLPGIPAEDLVEVYVSLGDARFRIGRQRQASEAYRQARRRLQADPVRAALLLRREAEIDYRLARFAAGLGKLTRGLRLLDGHDDRSQLAARSRLEGFYALIRHAQGRYREALSWARRAEEHATASGDLGARAEAVQAVVSALAVLGDTSLVSAAEDAVALYERMGDRAGQSRALNNLAMLAWLDGRGLEALDMFRRAEQLAVEAGDTVRAAFARYNVGDVLLRLGRAEQARDLFRELLPVLRFVGLEDYTATATRALGTALALTGRDEEGVELLHRARSRLEDLGEAIEVLETDADLAWVMLETGRPGAAAAVASQGAKRAEALGAGDVLARLMRLHGGALTDTGRRDAARTLLDRALELADTQSRVERGFVLAEHARLAGRISSGDDTEQYARGAAQAWAALGFAGTRRYPVRSP